MEYDTSGGRISVTTEPTGVSHLLLRHATPADSANYTCSPSAGAPASLTLNVIVGECLVMGVMGVGEDGVMGKR